MRVLLLSDISNTHTQKWVRGLHDSGVEVAVFSLSPYDGELPKGVLLKTLSFGKDFTQNKSKVWSKFSYLKALPKLKKFIKSFSPDVLHAHFASSYGLLGALSRFKPFIISVWGSDVYQFPKKSPIHRRIFKYNLSKASAIFSTSEVMKQETLKYTTKDVGVIPFGIDPTLFWKVGNSSSSKFVVGTVKALEHIYGIDLLIRSFALLVERNPDKELELQIVGNGSQAIKLKALVQELSLVEKVIFKGFIPQNQLANALNNFDVFVALSREESFGVAIIEAGACELPVVVSDVGGLPEVVVQNETGIIVPNEDFHAATDAIQNLLDHEDLRNKYGEQARKRILELYSWEHNVQAMKAAYENIVK